ncbi:MAG: hypothetical protein IKH41_00005 [Clostridia bacterium]|nr:hypothetical protein [Clostridia bacterium]
MLATLSFVAFADFGDFGWDNDYGGSDWGGDWGGCAGNILQMVACGHFVRSFTS